MGSGSRHGKRSGYSSGKRPSAGKVRSVRRKLMGLGNKASTAQGRAYRANTTSSGFMGIEHKFYDTGIVAAALVSSTSATGGMHNPSATSLISTPAQDDGPSDRNGKKILIESVYLSGFIEFVDTPSAQALTDAIVYVAIIQDTQTNAAAMTSELAFVNPSTNAFLSANPLKNLLRSTRFNTLKVWTITPGNRSIASEADDKQVIMGVRVPIEVYKKVSIPVNFNGVGTNASVANVSDNSLHVVAFCTLDGVATLSYNARIRFVG